LSAGSHTSSSARLPTVIEGIRVRHISATGIAADLMAEPLDGVRVLDSR
jgi:hypothetical protein